MGLMRDRICITPGCKNTLWNRSKGAKYCKDCARGRADRSKAVDYRILHAPDPVENVRDLTMTMHMFKFYFRIHTWNFMTGRELSKHTDIKLSNVYRWVAILWKHGLLTVRVDRTRMGTGTRKVYKRRYSDIRIDLHGNIHYDNPRGL
jgi:hypothetical protein